MGRGVAESPGGGLRCSALDSRSFLTRGLATYINIVNDCYPAFKMKEIRIHGRGGQGSVTAAELLAVSAFEDGLMSQAFPLFGTERRGAPVTAFVRLSDEKIRLRSQIYEPGYVIVQDASLLSTVDVTEGLRGPALVNSKKSPEELDLDAEVSTIDATGIALEELGVPIMNTSLLGAFSGATGEVSVDAIKNAVRERFGGEIGEKNARAVHRAYEEVGV